MTPIPINDALLQIFNVEHGACALLTVPASGGGWKRMLIDCGHNATTKWYPGDHLRRLGVKYLDRLIVTNYDEDHVSGYPNLLQQDISIGWYSRNPSVAPLTICQLKSEDGMGAGINALVSTLATLGPFVDSSAIPSFPGVQVETFYNPYPQFDDENNLSLVLHLTIRGISFLFPGDMECAGFENLLSVNARFREVVAGVNVLMASHHGRHNGVCPSMFDTYGCRPAIVVISDDYKQHDTQETVSYYSGKCSGIAGFRNATGSRKVLTTRGDGEIHFNFVQGKCWAS